MKLLFTLPLLTFCALAGCRSTINMPTDHAKLSDGYINSSTLDFGHVLVWDTSTNRVESIYRIVPSQVPSATVDQGPRYQTKESSVSHDTNLEVVLAPGVSEAAAADAKTKFIQSTSVTLSNYNPREYRDARYVLNSPELRAWRTSLAEEFSSPNYRFIFISRVTDGEALEIKREANYEAGGNLNVVKSGRYTFNVSYDKKNNLKIVGEQTPLVIRPTVFRFDVNGSECRFHRDLQTPLPFQSLKRA